jgi:phosphoribosylaminoimidazole-succinocarboxamide synthase
MFVSAGYNSNTFKHNNSRTMLVLETSLQDKTPKRGKVRDIYTFNNDVGNDSGSESVLLVSTDRISAFDWVLPTGIPDKGKVLNQTAAFWFEFLGVPNHIITTDVRQMPFPKGTDLTLFEGRSTLGKKCSVVPIECVVRGYLSGSGWKEYQRSGSVCGVKLPAGLKESSRLPEPIFTPSTKAETGHDENITFEQTVEITGKETAEKLREKSLDIFKQGSQYALSKGIIIADTKFEFGYLDSELLLIDEVLTPDSSRFWSVNEYEPGKGQPSFDKQFVRDWLLQSGWDRNSTPPELPADVVEKTREKYIKAFEILTGRTIR